MKEVNVVLQGSGTKSCGQCSVAMLTGRTLEKVVEFYGHDTTSDMGEAIDALNHFGFTTSKITKIDNRKVLRLPKTALVRLKFGNRRIGHFVALIDGEFYDPSRGHFKNSEELFTDYNDGGYKRYANRNKWLFSHYVEVKETPKRITDNITVSE